MATYRHNLHNLATENPHWMQHTQVRWLNVWAGIFGDHIIGAHFFDDKINGKEYQKFLQNDNLLEEVSLELHINMWFQQNGHLVYTAETIRMLLNKKFSNHWIGLRGTHEWPRLPDLTTLDFFLSS